MTDASYSHKFMSALAESLGWNPTDVQKALAEIAQLQTQTQELELSVQGKAPTNHASQQPIFGTADEQMYGHVKVTHEVTNDSTAGVAVSPDAVYAYAPAKGMAAEMPVSGDYLIPGDYSRHGLGAVALTKNGQLCVTGTMVFTADIKANTDIFDLSFVNMLDVGIPCIGWRILPSTDSLTPDPDISCITPEGRLNASGLSTVATKIIIVVTAGIYPIFAKVKEQ